MKQKLCMLLVAMMVFISIAPVYAVNDLTHLKSVKVVSFGYYNGETKITTSTLPSNTEITLKATVQKVGYNDYNSMRMILVIYNNGAMIGINSDNQTFPFVGAKKEFQASVTTPADTSACEIQAFLWSGYDTMIPIGDYSAIGKNNSDLSGILIDGVPLSGFNSTTYSYTLIDQIPKEIIQVCPDLGTTYTISQNEDEITIDTVAPNGSTKTYVISLQANPPSITNITQILTHSSGAPGSYNIEIGGPLRFPNYNYDLSGNIVPFSNEAEYNANVTRLNGYRYSLFDTFPEELTGAQVLQLQYRESHLSSTDKTVEVTFTTNKSITVYFHSSSALASQYGYTQTGYPKSHFKVREVIDATSEIGGAMDFMGWPDYKLNCIVPQGQTGTFTIRLDYTGVGNLGSTVLAMPYVDSEGVVSLPNISNITQTLTHSTGEPGLYNIGIGGPLRFPNYNYDLSGNIVPFSSEAEYNANVTRLNGYRYNLFDTFPKELTGAQVLQLQYRESHLSSTDKTVEVTFTTNKSITVYFHSSSALATQYGYTQTGYPKSYFKVREVITVTTEISGAMDFNGWPNYKLNCIVPQGQTGTFTIRLDYTGVGNLGSTVLAMPYANIPDISFISQSGQPTTENTNSLGLLQYPNYQYDEFGNIRDWDSDIEFRNNTSKVFTDRGFWHYTDFPAEMEGAEIIGLKNDYKNNQSMVHKLNFKLNKTSTLYFYCNSALAEAYGAEKLVGELRIAEKSSLNPPVVADKTLYSDIYKIELIVPAGEEEAEFEIEILGRSGTYGPVAFIK